MLLMIENKLIVVCDPYGFRPLVMGAMSTMTLFASQSYAFDLADGNYIPDNLLVEMVVEDE